MKEHHKTVILTHSDCDGMCAGAVALTKYPNAEVFFTKPVSFLADLKHVDADRLIVTDIAITKRDAVEIVKLLNKMTNNGMEILYFDHHILPDSISESSIKVTLYKHDTSISASELIYKHFMKQLPRERVWLALYGAIGDYSDDSDFTKEKERNWDMRALYFEVSTLVMGIKNHEFESYDAKRKILHAIADGSNPSDVPGLVDSARKAVTREFELYEKIKIHAKKFGSVGVMERLPNFGFRGPSALFAATVTDAPMGLSIFEKRDNFDITARTRVNWIDLKIMMETCADAVGGSGGGHPQAAGARIPSKKLGEFLTRLNVMIDEHVPREKVTV